MNATNSVQVGRLLDHLRKRPDEEFGKFCSILMTAAQAEDTTAPSQESGTKLTDNLYILLVEQS